MKPSPPRTEVGVSINNALSCLVLSWLAQCHRWLCWTIENNIEDMKCCVTPSGIQPFLFGVQSVQEIKPWVRWGFAGVKCNNIYFMTLSLSFSRSIRSCCKTCTRWMIGLSSRRQRNTVLPHCGVVARMPASFFTWPRCGNLHRRNECNQLWLGVGCSSTLNVLCLHPPSICQGLSQCGQEGFRCL